MEKQITVKFVIAGKEIGVVRKCLDYAYHRLSQHKDSGLEGVVTLEAVEELRQQFK